MSETLLREALAEAATLLESVGETFWSTRMRQALARASIDPWAVEHWYGGMGSFNDLVISGVNGHKIEPSAQASDQLKALRARIYQLSRDRSN